MKKSAFLTNGLSRFVSKTVQDTTVVTMEDETEGERERESRFLTAHQHKNRPFSAIRGETKSKMA